MQNKCIVAAILAIGVAACGSVDRLKLVGKVPPLSPMDTMDAPSREASLAYQSLTDPAAPRTFQPPAANGTAQAQNASLFRSSARAFFADQRANRVGDILTVRIRVDDKANVDNTTTRSRDNSENAGIPAFGGLESQLSKLLPNAVNPSSLISGNSQSKSSGSGQIQRRDTVNMTIAGIVTTVLPNGNLVIRGRQEVRVNFEVRELIISGIVRPEDISRSNTIDHTQIAEARISYGGRGQLTDVQQARYGQQIYDALFPF
jgi:flagellar L-ring protein FlgH